MPSRLDGPRLAVSLRALTLLVLALTLFLVLLLLAAFSIAGIL